MGVENYIFWVWKRVRIWRTRQHTPTKNSQEHLPGRICCPLVFIAQRTQKAKWCLVYFQMRKTRKSGRVKDWVCNISTHEDFDFDSSTVEPTLRMFQTMQLWGFFFIQYLCISQFQLHPAPPRGYCGAFARLFSPGGGAFANFVLPGGWAFANPEPFLSFWHTRSFLSENNYTEDFTGKESRLAHLSRTGKIEEVCKGMFLILCMHFFIAYRARIT